MAPRMARIPVQVVLLVKNERLVANSFVLKVYPLTEYVAEKFVFD